MTVLFLDLDGFKAVNDALGHEGGDRLLEEVGRRLDLCVRSSDMVARLGGDEFVVLLEEIGDEGEAALAADRIKRELEAPFKIGRRELPLTASIGVAVGPPVGGGPGGCCATPTWRCTGPKRTARTALRCATPANSRSAAAGGASVHNGLT